MRALVREGQVRTRLAAGGRWIRTCSTAARETRCVWRRATVNFIAVSSWQGILPQSTRRSTSYRGSGVIFGQGLQRPFRRDFLVNQSPPIRNLSWRRRAHGSHWHALRREAAGVRRVSDRGSARPGRQRGGHQGPHRKARVGVCKTRLQRRGRQKGQGRPDRPRLRSENRPQRKGAPLFRRASRWQHRRQSQRRHVRRRGAGRARGLFLDRRLRRGFAPRQ